MLKVILTKYLKTGEHFHFNLDEYVVTKKIPNAQIINATRVDDDSKHVFGYSLDVVVKGNGVTELDEIKQVPTTQSRKKKWPEPEMEEPSMDELEEYSSDGVCPATDGCDVEPDGICPHGHPSWMLKLGFI